MGSIQAKAAEIHLLVFIWETILRVELGQSSESDRRFAAPGGRRYLYLPGGVLFVLAVNFRQFDPAIDKAFTPVYPCSGAARRSCRRSWSIFPQKELKTRSITCISFYHFGLLYRAIHSICPMAQVFRAAAPGALSLCHVDRKRNKSKVLVSIS